MKQTYVIKKIHGCHLNVLTLSHPNEISMIIFQIQMISVDQPVEFDDQEENALS